MATGPYIVQEYVLSSDSRLTVSVDDDGMATIRDFISGAGLASGQVAVEQHSLHELADLLRDIADGVV